MRNGIFFFFLLLKVENRLKNIYQLNACERKTLTDIRFSIISPNIRLKSLNQYIETSV